MSSQCSICLSSLKEPVSIPCGHIYCAECLGEHITSAPQDGYTSTCPTCRTEFPIVSPERTYLPKQVQKFLFPVIRRVYLPDSASQALQAENQRLHDLLDTSIVTQRRLEDQVEHLMDQCERHMSSSAAHAKGEKDASLEVERLRRKLEHEMGLRRDAEEARNTALKLYQQQVAIDAEVRTRNSDEELWKRATANAETWARMVVRARRGPELDHGKGRSDGSGSGGGRNAILTVADIDYDDNSSGDEDSIREMIPILQQQEPTLPQKQNLGLSASNPSPIRVHRGAKRYIDLSDSDSDSDSDILEEVVPSVGNVRQPLRPQAVNVNQGPSGSSSSITPRRRVMRQLPPQPPTKRIRSSGVDLCARTNPARLG
ncbi:hypothetical protein L218DRAFT_425580 [Marasmius fiardii PR-910]|nr:hypothetical protein L218DRAFT_425580 [Marasmius fiardii PR-910]